MGRGGRQPGEGVQAEVPPCGARSGMTRVHVGLRWSRPDTASQGQQAGGPCTRTVPRAEAQLGSRSECPVPSGGPGAWSPCRPSTLAGSAPLQHRAQLPLPCGGRAHSCPHHMPVINSYCAGHPSSLQVTCLGRPKAEVWLSPGFPGPPGQQAGRWATAAGTGLSCATLWLPLATAAGLSLCPRG